MTYEDLKEAVAKAYLEEKRTGDWQGIIVPADLLTLLINLATEADRDAEGKNGHDSMVSFETIEALNALDDYSSEGEESTIH